MFVNYIINKFISTQVYKTKKKNRAIIVNEIENEWIELEDQTVLLWSEILKLNIFNSIVLSNAINKPANEIEKFLVELKNANIIRSSENIKENEQIKLDSQQEKNQVSYDRYSSGNYNEPPPGGSNQEEEIEFMEWATENGFLYSASWEITYRCNERCVHCFNPGASHVEGDKSFRKVEEVDTKKILKTIDELHSLGVFRLLITGGELFLRKDIFEIIEYINKKRISYTFYTNGTLLDKDKIEKISRYYPNRVELSLYSADAHAHDKITRLKNSWKKTVDAALLFKKLKINTSLKMVVMKDTINHVDQFTDFCDKNNLEYALEYQMSAGVDGNAFPIKNLLPDAKDLILSGFNEKSPLYVGTLKKSRSYDAKKLEGDFVCGAGRTTMNITSEGNISPCNSLPLEYGNIKTDSIEKIWKNSSVGKKEFAKYSKEVSLNGSNSEKLSSWQGVRRGMYDVCGSFERCNWCQKCPGMAYLETGSELKPSTTNCRNSAARMIAYDLLKKYKNIEEVFKNIDIEKLKNKYSSELALWDPLKNIENNKEKDHQNIILNRTKPSALEQLLKKEKFIS